MKKMDAYRILTNAGRDLGWIANVFLTGGGPNSAKTIIALAILHLAGYDIGSLSFTMPYDRLLVNGDAMTPEQVRTLYKRVQAEA